MDRVCLVLRTSCASDWLYTHSHDLQSLEFFSQLKDHSPKNNEERGNSVNFNFLTLVTSGTIKMQEMLCSNSHLQVTFFISTTVLIEISPRRNIYQFFMLNKYTKINIP